MNFLDPYIIIPLILTILSLIIVVFVIKIRKNFLSGINNNNEMYSDKNEILKEANKRLTENPKDSKALLKLADMYYHEKNYKKAYKLYNLLLDLSTNDLGLDQFDITIKHAICALNEKNYQVARKGFLIARGFSPDAFLINYNLGYIEYIRKNYEKSVAFLLKAKKEKPDDAQTYKYLGLSLQKLNKFSLSAKVLERALVYEPDNKEILFAFGDSNYSLGKNEIALKAFEKVKNDPKFGASACAYAGNISMKFRKYDQAIEYLVMGLKYPGLGQTLVLEMKYNLATCYIKNKNISEAIAPLDEIVKVNSNYKDASILLGRYGELDSNFNLKVFLIGERGRFISMCESLISAKFPNSRISITDVSTKHSEYADITAVISTSTSESIIVFRFARTSGQVGELIVRDLFEKIKEIKAEKGLCISAGTFSRGAKNFVEARLIDLIEKDALLQLLKKVRPSE